MSSPQIDLFASAELPVPDDIANSTALYPNRRADKRKVETLLHLPEHGDEQTEFRTSRGTWFARGYKRVVYGDHGPYVEFRRDHIVCRLHRKFNQPPPPDCYYEWLLPDDGSELKVYDQKRDVSNLPNPPGHGFVGNRPKGYADYRPGLLYVSVWELVISRVPEVCVGN